MRSPKRTLSYCQFQEQLNLTPEQTSQAFREAGIPLSEDVLNGRRNLSPEEIDRLRPLAIRFYQARERLPESDANRARPSGEAKTPPRPDASDSRRMPAAFPAPDTAMDKIAAEHVIMIDTCSLMFPMCGKVVEDLIPSLKKYGKKIILPQRVFQELKKHEQNLWNRERAQAARNGLALCQELLNADCLKKMGSEKDNFADNLFFVHFSNYRALYRMLLITQDGDLTRDILQLNEMDSVNAYPVRVMRVTYRGELTDAHPTSSAPWNHVAGGEKS